VIVGLIIALCILVVMLVVWATLRLETAIRAQSTKPREPVKARTWFFKEDVRAPDTPLRRRRA
jgi:hypothetical protein